MTARWCQLVLAEWAVGPYYREVSLPEPVNGALTNATYGNGDLVLSMPKAQAGDALAAEIRLEAVDSTRGEHVGHVGRAVNPTTTRAHRQASHRGAPPAVTG